MDTITVSRLIIWRHLYLIKVNSLRFSLACPFLVTFLVAEVNQSYLSVSFSDSHFQTISPRFYKFEKKMIYVLCLTYMRRHGHPTDALRIALCFFRQFGLLQRLKEKHH